MNKKGDSTLKICEQKLNYLSYANKTRMCYLSYIKDFIKKQSKSPLHLNSKDFQTYLDNYKFTSISQQKQVISSIKFLYKEVLGKKYDKVSFTHPRKEKKLPRVIDNDFIINRLITIKNLKHRAILSLTYSVGLRVSEVVNLKIEDIDSKRMIIHIKDAKGRKDRVVPLSNNILELLRTYYKKYYPKVYLFNGMSKTTLKYSIASCQKIYKKYIDNKSSIHILRHSCFTNLLESGTNIRIIQKIAGLINIS